METFIQPKIIGYRQLSEDEAVLMNEGKALAEACGVYVEKLRNHIPQNMEGPEGQEIKPGATLDQRWVSIGATDLQRGFMALMRGIAKPTSF
jgi:hypothetical protein